MNIITIADCSDYAAPDLAVAKEFISPHVSGLQNLSIGEITIPPGVAVKKHYHRESEEVYHVVSGAGFMLLGQETSPIKAGQSVAIKIGQLHRIANPNQEPLVMIVTCSPPWKLEDQIFAEDKDPS